jgi:2-keto-4-pentenoate hydratase
MTQPTPISNLVDDLNLARTHAQPIAWSLETPADLPTAYAAALAVREGRIAQGEMPVGFKVGFTNRTIWPVYGVYAPIWGTVWRHTLTRLDANAEGVAGEGVVRLAGLCEPRIEPEIVFGFRAPPPPDCDLQGLLDAVEWIAHGFEIVHTHFPGWKFTAAQAVADSGLHGHLLVGPPVAVAAGTPAQPWADALSSLRLELHHDGKRKDEGRGANVLDGPLQALLYFVRALRATPGSPDLQAGDVVTTGTLTDAHAVQAGEAWHTVIDMPQGVAAPVVLQGLRVRFTP